MSESIEMYLVMTALLRSAPDQPVAVSHLASKLGVTQVSANEMCHKLSERGLMTYQPYKGVTLTETGEADAQAILSRRRLWVVFLVQNLGIGPEEADALACQLEHITSERLVVALKTFIEHPPMIRCPKNDLVEVLAIPASPLTNCAAGTHGQIALLQVPPMVASFLRAQGLTQGAEVEVLAVSTEGAVLVAIADQQVALAASVASHIMLNVATETQTVRHVAWARCSAFWSCPRGEDCGGRMIGEAV